MKKKLTDICRPKQWKTIPGKELLNEGFPVYGANGIVGYWSEFNHAFETIIIACRGTCGTVNITVPKSYINGNAMCLDDLSADILPKYLYYYLKGYNFSEIISGTAIPQITIEGLKKVEVPIPSKEKQQEIVDVFERVEYLIEGRKKELQKLNDLTKARFVEMFGDPEHNEKHWNVFKLDTLCTVGSSKRIYQNEQSSSGVPFLRISDLVNRMDTGSTDCELYIPKERYEELKKQGLVPVAGDILVTARGTLGRCYIIKKDDKFYFQDGMITWLSDFNKSLTTKYLSYLFKINGFRKQIDGLQAGSTVAYLSISMTKKLDIMLPPVELQNEFTTFVEQVDKSKFVVQKALDEAQTLFDSLMQEYFG